MSREWWRRSRVLGGLEGKGGEKGGRTAAGDEDGVDAVEGRVLLLVDDVVGGDFEAGGGGEAGMVELVGAGLKEAAEDVTVGAVAGEDGGERGVGLEDGDAEGEGGAHGGGNDPGGL